MKAVLIAGPTASGKSALALVLAEKYGGVIVNADSMQVYRDLRIITARPSLDEEGLAAVPPTPAEIRVAVRARLAANGAQSLHAELQQRDPAMAVRLKPGDGVRVARALEVFEATGRSLAEWQRDGMPGILKPEHAVKIFLMPDRAELHRRIDARFDVMLGAGALDEVRALDARGLDPLLPAMKAHGVPWLRRYLRGEITLETVAVGAKQDTRRYTKRQLTWFRNQMPGWMRAAPEEAAQAALELISAL